SLDAMDEIIACNHRNYEAYREGLAGLPGIKLIDYDSSERNNYQYVVVEADPYACPASRDEILASLHAENIIARKYFWPGCHRMEPYRSTQPNAGLLLGATEHVANNVIVLPSGQGAIHSDVRRVCGHL